MSVPYRFWAKVNKTDTCWLWLATKSHDGYGHFRVGRKMVYAHRYLYEVTVNTVPKGLELDHICRTRHCVNLNHLEPVTHKENMRRSLFVRAPKTHCPRGHEYSKENTRVYKNLKNCRTCNRIRALREYHERKNRK